MDVSIHGGSDVIAGHGLANLLERLRWLASVQVRGTREWTPMDYGPYPSPYLGPEAELCSFTLPHPRRSGWVDKFSRT